MTTSDDLAADLESLAARIERLSVVSLPEFAGADTWSMPIADHCRHRLRFSRERLLAVAADLRRQALTVRTTRSMGAIR